MQPVPTTVSDQYLDDELDKAQNVAALECNSINGYSGARCAKTSKHISSHGGISPVTKHWHSWA